MVSTKRWVGSLVGCLLALAAAGGEALSESFDGTANGALPDGFVAESGSWAVADGALVGASAKLDASSLAVCTIARVGGPMNLRFSADLTILEVGEPKRWAGLLFRKLGRGNCQWVQFITRQADPSGPEIALRVPRQNQWEVPARSRAASDMPLGTTRRLLVEVTGGTAVGSLDGQEVVRCESVPLQSGAVALGLSGARARFDNVTVEPLPATPIPTPASGEAILSESFDQVPDGRLPDGWRVAGGNWAVRGGKLQGEATDYLSRILFPLPPEQEVAIEADVAFLSAKDPGRWLALLTRQPAGRSAPFLLFTSRFDRTQKSGVELGFRTADDQWSILTALPVGLPPLAGESHRLRIEVRGESARGLIDGVEVVRARLPQEALQPGELGLMISNVSATFDNLTVQRLPVVTAAEREAALLGEFAGPLVVAHRGNSRHAPENTLAAIREAFDAGADIVEVDLRVSRDGVLVLSHDDTVDRCTNGQGKVAELTLAELQALDAGGWKHEKYRGERIPTLREALELAQDRGALSLDLKLGGLAEGIAKLVAELGLTDQILACPWTAEAVADVRRQLPQTPVLLIGSAPESPPADYFAKHLAAGLSGFWYDYQTVTPPFVRAARRRALSVFVWTVNDPAALRQFLRMGVDGILTDDPAAMVATIREARLAAWGPRAGAAGQ